VITTRDPHEATRVPRPSCETGISVEPHYHELNLSTLVLSSTGNPTPNRNQLLCFCNYSDFTLRSTTFYLLLSTHHLYLNTLSQFTQHNVTPWVRQKRRIIILAYLRYVGSIYN
jgi:hypothetical protein